MGINSPLRNEEFDTGSNYNFYEKMLKTGVPRSLFDLSHLVTTTIDNAGKVIPLSVIPTLPGDDMDISVTALLRVMPQVVPLYSRQRLYIYAFWSRNSDLWCNWQTFTKRGLSGNKILHTPSLKFAYIDEEGVDDNFVSAGSLGDMLGLPIGFTDTNDLHINALPAMMYLRIWRDYFCDPNFFLSDEIIFPDDDSRFRLDNDGNLLSAKDLDGSYSVQFDMYGLFDNIFYRRLASPNTDDYSESYNSTYNELTVSFFYHDFAPDRFTTALPFAQRGDISRATINLQGSVAGTIPALDVDMSDLSVSGAKYISSGSSHTPNYRSFGVDVSGSYPFGFIDASSEGEQNPSQLHDFTSFNNFLSGLTYSGVKTNSKSFTASTSGLTFNIDDLRQIIIAESEMEKMARTDGSYGQFVETFFNVHPKSAYDYRPVFIGGTHQNLLFSEVLQQSSTDSTSPLGSYAGHGISGAGDNGYIGHLKSDDYGYLMILACVMPDVYYSQGIDKHWTTELQTDLYLPERSEIGLQPVFNYELYALGGDLDGLFGYNDPFDEYRYMANRIHGKIADSSNESFYPYTQSRKFNSTPTLGRSFSEARQVRKDYLAAPTEDAYSTQFDINIRAVRPLPYKSTPALFV